MMYLFNIANILTLLNLLAGSLAVYFAIVKMDTFVPYLLFTSLVMDFLDGFAARRFVPNNLIGKDLDSLADVVSFGFLPAILVLRMFSFDDMQQWWMFVIPFVLLLMTALRLAKFNQENRDPNYFYGLNAPTNTIFIFGLYMAWLENSFGLVDFFYHNALIMILLVILCSFLLLSNIKMISTKTLMTDRRTQIIFLILGIMGVVTLATMGYLGLSITVIFYMVMSIINYNIQSNKQ